MTSGDCGENCHYFLAFFRRIKQANDGQTDIENYFKALEWKILLSAVVTLYQYIQYDLMLPHASYPLVLSKPNLGLWHMDEQLTDQNTV